MYSVDVGKVSVADYILVCMCLHVIIRDRPSVFPKTLAPRTWFAYFSAHSHTLLSVVNCYSYLTSTYFEAPR